MKQIILIAAILFSRTSQAQTVHFDTAANTSYINIQPVSWKRNMPDVSRLYVSIHSNLNSTLTVNWYLKDSVYIDAVTNNYNLIDNGIYQIPLTDYSQVIDDLIQGVFSTICDTAHLNLTYK